MKSTSLEMVGGILHPPAEKCKSDLVQQRKKQKNEGEGVTKRKREAIIRAQGYNT